MNNRINALLEETIAQLMEIDPARTSLLISFRKKSLDLLSVLQIEQADLEEYKKRYQQASPEMLSMPEFLSFVFNPENHVVNSDLTEIERVNRERFNAVCAEFSNKVSQIFEEEQIRTRLSALPPEMLLTAERPFTAEQYRSYAGETKEVFKSIMKTWDERVCLEQLLSNPTEKLKTRLFDRLFDRIQRGLVDEDPEIKRITRFNFYYDLAFKNAR